MTRDVMEPDEDAEEFQSLLHQGISLLETITKIPQDPINPIVSIPSSSGHQFTVSTGLEWFMLRMDGFQSLLHQGISLLECAQNSDDYMGTVVSIPSSSGHQFTELHQHQPCSD